MLLPDIRIPTLLLSESVCRRNIAHMRDRARAHGLHFRPHFKTHQSRRIGSWFRDEGVTSITVSSVGMARYFADDDWEDITIAFPVNLREVEDIDSLAAQVALGVLLESVPVAQRLDAALKNPVDVWIKIDTGYGRSGIAHDDIDALRRLAETVGASRHLRPRGILTHGGDTYRAAGPAEVLQRFSLSRDRMIMAADSLRDQYPEIRISVGDTPGCTLADDFSGIDEIRPGNFVFYDVMQLQRGVCRAEDIAVALACPVVSLHERRSEVVLYGGAVHLSREHVADARGTQLFGLVAQLASGGWGAPLSGAFVTRMSQEHGIVHLPDSRTTAIIEGDLLAILPVHSCLTAECMKGYRLLDGSSADHFAGVSKLAPAPSAPAQTDRQETHTP
ncbi:MAG: alanine racemase [Bacteroidetes bacterium]|nr:alanine racemase [Bacteroidota bacterium]